MLQSPTLCPSVDSRPFIYLFVADVKDNMEAFYDE